MEEIDKDQMRSEIPERFRASTDAADKAAFELLRQNDENQKKLAEKVNASFSTHSPKDRMRSNAMIRIKEFERIQEFEKLTPEQNEMLSEFYAAVGQFDKAKSLTLDPLRRAEYIKYHNAVWLNDEDFCDHGERAKYIKDYVWSIRESREVPLIACNECGMWNVVDPPERLLKAQSLRSEVRANRARMSEPEFSNYIEQFKRKDKKTGEL